MATGFAYHSNQPEITLNYPIMRAAPSLVHPSGTNYYAVNDDFNRNNYPASQHLPRLLSGSVPFLNMAAGSYTFTFGLARSDDSNIGIRRNYRVNSDGINGTICSSSMYIQEIAG